MRHLRAYRYLPLLIATGAIADELLVNIDPSEAQAVIQRNVLEYEDRLQYSFPDHIRIMKANVDLLKQKDVELTITTFPDVPAVFVRSAGVSGSTWNGTKTQGGISDDDLRVVLESEGREEHDFLLGEYNNVELRLWVSLRDRNTLELIDIQEGYQIIPAGKDIGPTFNNLAIFRESEAEEITSILGEIRVFDPSSPGGVREISLGFLTRDPDYVLVHERDHSKGHFDEGE